MTTPKVKYIKDLEDENFGIIYVNNEEFIHIVKKDNITTLTTITQEIEHVLSTDSKLQAKIFIKEELKEKLKEMIENGD